MGLRTGVAYMGNRTLRHVAADMQDIAAAGYDYVVHCYTESDLLWGQETMREIVRISHEVGLEVHLDPWGFAGVFGGEALSKFVTWETGLNQVIADGSQVGITCLHQPKLRAFMGTWIDAAIDSGADVLFWDEPHWYPGDLWYYGEVRGDPSRRWSCRCDLCQQLFRERFGHDMPLDRTPEVDQLRHDAVFAFTRDLVGMAKDRGVRQGLCLLPHGITFDLVGVADWEPYLAIPGLDFFGTDPYWRAGDTVPMEPYVRPNAVEVREACRRHGLENQFWVQCYGFPAGTEHEIADAIGIALDEGMTDIGIWSYRGFEPFSKLWPADIEKVWAVTNEALASGRARLG